MKQNKRYLYLKAFNKALHNFNENIVDRNFKKVIFYGVKVVNQSPKPKTHEEALTKFNMISIIKELIAKLTLKEFMNMYPITKDFTGYKYEMKDYYSAKEYIDTLEHDQPIGDNVLMLLMEYMNKDIDIFNIKSITILSDLRRYEGHLSLMEEFMASTGTETPNTFKNSRGQPYYVRKGKPEAIERKKQNHLRLIN